MRKLNFGSGKDVREGYDNVDYTDFDFQKTPYPIEDNKYDYIMVKAVLEHMQDPIAVLNKLYRIAKPDATIYVLVPYYNSSTCWGCIEHTKGYTYDSFKNIDIDSKATPCCQLKAKFKVDRIHMIPTRFGKIFPKFLRLRASFIFGEIFQDMEVDLRCIK
jgi:SAM-dependent methyltransferase